MNDKAWFLALFTRRTRRQVDDDTEAELAALASVQRRAPVRSDRSIPIREGSPRNDMTNDYVERGNVKAQPADGETSDWTVDFAITVRMNGVITVYQKEAWTSLELAARLRAMADAFASGDVTRLGATHEQ